MCCGFFRADYLVTMTDRLPSLLLGAALDEATLTHMTRMKIWKQPYTIDHCIPL